MKEFCDLIEGWGWRRGYGWYLCVWFGLDNWKDECFIYWNWEIRKRNRILEKMT